MEILQLLESIKTEQASVARIFGSEGRQVRGLAARIKDYPKKLEATVHFMSDIYSGRRPMWQLKEALSTDDFPLLFGDTIDRMMLAKYGTIPPTWESWLKRSTVRDFRFVKRFRCTRGAGFLDPLSPGESYKGDAPSEASYQFKVGKYGRRRDMLWEALINDDLDALRSAPDDLAYQATNTESLLASSLYVANTDLFNTDPVRAATDVLPASDGNLLSTLLTVENLEIAVNTMALWGDDNGTPIRNAPKWLVTGPALSLTAKKILRSLQLAYTGGSDFAAHGTLNVLQGELTPVVDYNIPLLDPTNAPNMWFLFSDPNDGWCAEVAFLQGYETPQMFMKSPNQVALGGGLTDPLDGDFDNDNVAYKIRHVVGGSDSHAVGGRRFCLKSDGSMS